MTVSEQIIQVLDALCEKFGMAIDWTGENVIPYVTTLCTKLITYEIWTSVALMAIMVTLSILSIIPIKTLYPALKRRLDEFDYSFVSIFISVALAALYLATIICVGVQIMDIIKCVTFPELFVFEYVQSIVNGGTNG